ncbi:MAG TPA: superoxide dismutase, partial [Tepidisphaeraceae bacterium]|nr:superoxide dismutase [Tepidisphaeraceae bacterium]
MPFTLVPLPFPTDALEPYIDAKTMQVHHDGHHAAYVNNLNAALQKAPALEGKTLEELLANNLAIVPEPVKTPVRNNAGGDYNHRLFWEILNPAHKPGPTPVANLANAINTSFGSFDKFKEQFT